jgi:hypothetical protein
MHGAARERTGSPRVDDFRFQEVLRRLTPRVVAVTPLRRRLACTRQPSIVPPCHPVLAATKR